MVSLLEELEKWEPDRRLPAEQFLDDFGGMFCLKSVHSFTRLQAKHLELVAWNIGMEGESYSVLKDYEVFARGFGVDLRKFYLEGRKEREMQEAKRASRNQFPIEA